MKNFYLVLVICLFISTNAYADTLNFTFISDGFQQEEFTQLTNTYKNEILNDSVFSLRVNQITFNNQWYYNEKSFTTFNMYNIARLIGVSDYNILNNLIIKNRIQWDVIIVVKNDIEYGGSYGGNGVITISKTDYHDVLLHELGHAFGMADEYWTEDTIQKLEAPNFTKTKKNNFVELKDGWNIPTNDCKMGKLNHKFCRVCENNILQNFDNKLKEKYK